MHIRPARIQECDALTRVARRAKAHWDYPAPWLDAWRSDLTFTPDLLESTVTLVAEVEGVVVGVTCLDESGSPPELVHLWVDPEAMGRGFGSALFRETCRRARRAGHRRLVLDSDPNALDFYTKMGCVQAGLTPAPVLGIARELPRLEISLLPDSPR